MDIEQHVDADVSWLRDLQHVSMYGHKVSPRGMLVREAVAYTSSVGMKNPIIYNKQRNLGYRFMAAEAAWILSGDNKVKSIAHFSKEISKFSDNGDTFFGAYGPPVMEQLPYVIDCLIKDEDTRQAVLTIWRQSPGPSKDIPCTVAMQWMIRHGLLHCNVFMRSSDLWLGHPYDIFNFSAITFAILLELNNVRHDTDKIRVELGVLNLTAGSKHLYDRNMAGVEEVLAKHDFPSKREPVFDEAYYLDIGEFVDHLWSCANEPDGILTMGEGR